MTAIHAYRLLFACLLTVPMPHVELQRIRGRALAHFERAFQQCDIILTPATPSTAGDIPLEVHKSGSYDVAHTFEGVRFTQVCCLLRPVHGYGCYSLHP